MKRRLAILFLLMTLFSAAGAGCPGLLRRPGPSIPPALPASPTLEQVTEVVNRNSMSIRSFRADKAEISVTGQPTLRANMAMTRPHNFRLQAGTLVTGSELDLGSNDQYFWFWVKRDENKAVYYCAHDQFESSSLRHNMPFSPKELVEAFGLVEFDPQLPHHPPVRRPDGDLEVRTVYQTPNGPMTRVVVVGAASGWVLEQLLYDNRDQLIMHTKAQQHRRDPLTGLVMPKVVVISLPQNKMTMRVNLGNVAINTLDTPNPELWTMPVIQGTTMVNLAEPTVPSYSSSVPAIAPVDPPASAVPTFPATPPVAPSVTPPNDPYGQNSYTPLTIPNPTGSF